MSQPHSLRADSFAAAGFALVPSVLDDEACRGIAAYAASAVTGSAGTRCLLPQAWCRGIAKRLMHHPALAAFLPSGFGAVQCTYFEKSLSHNWLVAVHQDLSIPVAVRVDHPALDGWSEKEGTLFVQAPLALLQQLVAVRVHIDDCSASDGPLRVVPGSHVHGRIGPETTIILKQAQGEVVCTGGCGSVLVMRPLLLHASSKAIGRSRRRVLHFLFGPRELPYGLRWQHAVFE